MKVEVEAALQRIETGFATAADAEIIRQYLTELERELQSYQRWEASINAALAECGKYIP